MTAPRAAGVHLPWAEVPAAVRSWVEETMGSHVVSWADQVQTFRVSTGSSGRTWPGSR